MPTPAPYKVEVTLTFTSTWYFHHNDLMKIKDTVIRTTAGRLEKLEKQFPMFRFKDYDFKVTYMR